MGRTGAGSGGSRGGGGSSTGGRSHSQSSGSGRSARSSTGGTNKSSFSGSSSGSWGSKKPKTNSVHIHVHNRNKYSQNYGRNDYYPTGQLVRKRSQKRLSGRGILIILLVIFIFGLTFGALSNNAETNSKVVRTPLDKSLSRETAWFEDQNKGADKWVDNSRNMEQGLKYFYQKTGVRPFILILDNQNSLEIYQMTDTERLAWLNQEYDKRFSDQAHVLFVMSDTGDDWRYDDWVGAQAKTIIDAEAVNIVYDYLDKYWTTNMTTEELFEKSFTEAADRIMAPKPANIQLISIIGIIIIVILIVVTYAIKKRKEQKLKEMELTQKILETPLEELSQNPKL